MNDDEFWHFLIAPDLMRSAGGVRYEFHQSVNSLDLLFLAVLEKS